MADSLKSTPHGFKDREDALRYALSQTTGKTHLAAAMAQPIRHRLDYAGIFRKAVKITPIKKVKTKKKKAKKIIGKFKFIQQQ